MFIEIGYMNPTTGESLRRMVREEDITSVEPAPTDATKSTIVVRQTDSRFVQGSQSLTMTESYDSFKGRYSSAASGTKVVGYQAQDVQASTQAAQ